MLFVDRDMEEKLEELGRGKASRSALIYTSWCGLVPRQRLRKEQNIILVRHGLPS